MTAGERSPLRPTALVVGLLTLALLFVASTPAWYGSDPAHRVTVAADVLTPGAWIAQSSTAPTVTGATGHERSLWPLRHPVVERPVPALPAFAHGPADPDTMRSPQQTGQRTVGSRSPPQV